MSAQIRRATSRDGPIVALLGRITFTETFGHLFRNHFENDLRAYLDATFDVPKIERSVAKPENAYWLALWEGLPVGYAKLKHRSPLSATAPSAAQLQKIYVLGEFIGRGIGRYLIESVFAEAAVTVPAVSLDVLQENDRAVGFYRRHGFVVTGEQRFEIGAQQFLFDIMSRAVP
jgi:ribosomal protein S18 acetylase RimI-like enzyme